MTNFIPVFPLNIVVFPEEKLNLHVFEARYKELVKDCIAEKKPFGIPSVIHKVGDELGTLMEIVEVVKEYDNGEMDVRTKAVKVFRILTHVGDIPEKLYGGAIVTYPDNIAEPGDTDIAKTILNEVKRMYALLDVAAKFPKWEKPMISYEIGHTVGLSKEQEYELLGIFTEVQRLEYLRRHLNNILPVVKELEQMKARIQMNGHFRDLSLGID